MKNKHWLIIIIIAFAIGIIVLISQFKQPSKQYVFPDTLTVYNHTDYQEMDTIAMLILDKVLNIDTAILYIYYTPVSFDTENITIMGFVDKNQFTTHTYNIFCNKNITIPIEEFLSHELVHVDQMEKGLLVPVPGSGQTIMIYKGDTINLYKVPYNKRAYEVDAQHQSFEILKEFKSYR